MADDTWSVPEAAVLASTRELLASGRRGILATVVSVEGSAYRRPGAKMLIPEDGDGVGSITAGCLEDEVLRLASDVLAEGRPRVETFDLMGDDDVWGLGVGCNGIIDLLLEPVDNGCEPLLDAYESGESIAAITVIDSDHPSVDTWHRTHYQPGGGYATDPEAFPEGLAREVGAFANRLAKAGKADAATFEDDDGSVSVFVDGVTPPPTLVVLGTGHDVGPVVELGNKADFRTVVVGFRGATATEERFPDADRVVSTSPADVTDAVDVDEDTYVVTMTHNFVDDRLAVDEVLESPAPYVGLMGPRERFEEMLEDYEDEGRTLSQAELERVYTPIGLDLGGGTPYQIAHSIVAEVLAVRNDRRPRHLKDRVGPIHERVEPSERS